MRRACAVVISFRMKILPLLILTILAFRQAFSTDYQELIAELSDRIAQSQVSLIIVLYT